MFSKIRCQKGCNSTLNQIRQPNKFSKQRFYLLTFGLFPMQLNIQALQNVHYTAENVRYSLPSRIQSYFRSWYILMYNSMSDRKMKKKKVGILLNSLNKFHEKLHFNYVFTTTDYTYTHRINEWEYIVLRYNNECIIL